MLPLQDKTYCPTLDEIGDYIKNPVFWEKGWNVKFRKSGKSLCTIYPRESYFTVLLVVGPKEKEPFESILPDCTPALQEIYSRTKEGNGQRWLMADLEDKDALYEDIFRFLEIRSGRQLERI